MMPEFDREKFKELLLYVADRSQEDPKFGATKLNKILFFSEFFAYLNFGAPIAGATYQSLEHGPGPRELRPVRREMEQAGDLHIDRRRYLGFNQVRAVPGRMPDLSRFSPGELAIVDQVMGALRDMGAVDVSEVSHRLSMGWRIAGIGQVIPYESAFLSADMPSEDDILRGKELAAENDWVAV